MRATKAKLDARVVTAAHPAADLCFTASLRGPDRRASWRIACVLIGAAAALAACTDRRALTEAAEAEQRGPTAIDVPRPFEHGLVPQLHPCNVEAALAAMESPQAPNRAAGALCAAQSPCDRVEVDAALSRLTGDAAIAAEYLNRGPMFGSGDQEVRVPVSRYAVDAVAERGTTCPASRS